MDHDDGGAVSRHRDLLVLSIVPVIVGVLVLTSWALARWEIGPYFLNAGLALFAALFGGFQRFISGFRDILKRKITVNVFVVVALSATLAVGEFRPAAVIVFIMAVAGALESYTLDKTKRSIRGLLDLAPPTAAIRKGGEEITVPVTEIQADDIVVVRPGDRIPVDGIVATGASSVDQAPITGESVPVEKEEGDEVFAGTLNESGRLEIRTTGAGENTTLSKIVHLVQEAQGTRAPIQNIADKFTVYFLPAVVLLAIIGFAISHDVHVAVSVLLVACPCAFAIATPTALTAGVSNMARHAVLIKGGKFLELAQKIDTLLVDKTGTFTFGRPKATDIVAFGNASEHELLSLAATAEKYSEHPLAKSIIEIVRERDIEIPDPDEFEIKAGMGVKATWHKKCILVGKPQFLLDEGLRATVESDSMVSQYSEQGKTVILVSCDGTIIGGIAIADEVRPEAGKAIASLKSMGIKRIVMLTGDNEKVAKAVAEEIGVDDFVAELLPEAKQEYVRNLQSKGEIVGMIGDGINDAPALALADVGIAMAAAGTDIAIETADVALMNDNIAGVVDFVWMSGKVIRRIKINIFLSMIYNAIGLILGVSAMLTPVTAVLYQEAGCVSVVASSTLLLWSKRRRTS